MNASCFIELHSAEGDIGAEAHVGFDLEVGDEESLALVARAAREAIQHSRDRCAGPLQEMLAGLAIPEGGSATALLLLALADKLGLVRELCVGEDLAGYPDDNLRMHAMVHEFVLKMTPGVGYGLAGAVPKAFGKVKLEYAYVAEQEDDSLRRTEVNVAASRTQ